jgi:hypothetical protein
VFSRYDPSYSASLPQRHYDPAQAKSMLKAAGHENLHVQLVSAPIAQGATGCAQVFAQQAKAAGVTISLRQVTVTEFYGPQYLNWPFAQDFSFYQYYLPSVAQFFVPSGPYNECHYNNPRYTSLFNQALKIVDDQQRFPIIHGADRLRGELVAVLARLRSGLGLPAGLPVGVAVPELVDLDGLISTDVVVPGLPGDLREWTELGVVRVELDVRAAARAEAHVGSGRGFPSMAFMSIGTGISSAFVQHGVAWPGAHGAAILLGSGPLGLRPDGSRTSSKTSRRDLPSSPPFTLLAATPQGHARSWTATRLTRWPPRSLMRPPWPPARVLRSWSISGPARRDRRRRPRIRRRAVLAPSSSGRPRQHLGRRGARRPPAALKPGAGRCGDRSRADGRSRWWMVSEARNCSGTPGMSC